MLQIHVSCLARLKPEELQLLMGFVGIDKWFLAQKMHQRIQELKSLIDDAQSLMGDKYIAERAQKTCERFLDEIEMCKMVIGSLGLKQRNAVELLSRAEVRRLAREKRQQVK